MRSTLGAAHASYESVRSAAKSARAAEVGLLHAEEIDNARSTAAVESRYRRAAARVGRGAPPARVGQRDPQQATWITAWNAKVTQLVP